MKKTSFLLLAACGLLASVTLAQAQTTAFTSLNAGGLSISNYTAPGAAPATFTVTGTSGGEVLVSIDYFASSTRQLFGMAASGNLYTLAQSGATYTATLNNASGIAGVTTVDFNPAASRLRVYAGTGNYRVTPGTGGLVTSDGTLAYNAGDVNFGNTPALRASAYTNNFFGSTATALYSLDTTADALVMNTGTPQFNGLTTVATLTLAGVRFDIVPGTTGFDISAVGTAYVSSGNALYTVNLATGVLTSVGTQTNAAGIIDVTFAIPEPGTYALIAAGGILLGGIVVRRRQQAVA